MITGLHKTLVALLVAVAAPAWAGHNHDQFARHGHGQDQYRYAKVLKARPVFESVRRPYREQVCRERPVRQRVAEHRSAGPAIFGAVLGGVIGNQLSRSHGHGHGSNRAAATLAGAAIGGVVANEIQYGKYPPRYYTENARVCHSETRWHHEEHVIAWDVSYKYQGRVYHSRMAERPGHRIRIRVSVDPAYR